MVSLSENEDVSSSSGGSVEDEILRRPLRQDSFFKEEHLISTGSRTGTEFSVILNDTYIPESSDESKDRSISMEGPSVAYSKVSHSFSNSNSNSNSSTSSKQRKLANNRNSQYMRLSLNSTSSGSAHSTPLIGVNLQSDKFSSANTSRDTVNTEALLDPRRSFSNTPLVHSTQTESPQLSTSNDVGNATFPQDSSRDNAENMKRSSKAVSTPALGSSDQVLDERIVEETESDETSDKKNRTSSFYPAHTESLQADETHDIIDDYEYGDTKPAIEEAVKLFKMEARRANLLELNHGDNKNLHRRQTSLLSSILVPPPKSASKSSPAEGNSQEPKTLIPALRKVSGSSTPTARQGQFQPYEEQTANVNPFIAPIPAQPTSVPIEREISNHDYESDALHYIRASRKRLDEFNDMERNLPMQRVDVSSVNSEKSKISAWSQFSDLFSITRLLCLFLTCLIVPPLFFFIGFGEVTGFDDEKLMKFIMHSQHRYGLMPGFIWAVDLSWIRRIFIISGFLETVVLFACIGVGFGVGLSR
ncbi:Bud8p [Kluyveromyces lactis]|uniref:KLLA0A02541p n=1 Tax=Kluyveromyces lactis (strain ATCC 8585 / CBS 2359 / DSM 70799 / NBRC 1267 / NRRL Y-1140 / WM37) TaxID=284590 RepID=Q6CY77_KLULA|nr:uncharacterized protein KLLA0_A02541g [Kluyveromyces lactis]CAH02700.1 KLLA0A02541p [Kluyveromyces lactis]|eukprot:XP_451112.1 uncharacterized protein KLLA0_A02541g [Kluyveromyces lactis]